jgi:hypothetical protein
VLNTEKLLTNLKNSFTITFPPFKCTTRNLTIFSLKILIDSSNNAKITNWTYWTWLVENDDVT